MIYHGQFDNPHHSLIDVLLHIDSYGLSLLSATVSGGNVVVEVLGEIPQAELDHLGLGVVA